MIGKRILLPRLAASVAVLGLAVALASPARGDSVAYGFAEQTISDLSLTPGSGTLSATGSVTTGTTDSATQGPNGISHSDPLDALQSYLGTPPPPPENYFVKYAAFPVASPLPAGTAPNGLTTGPGTLASFTRGDVLITGLTPTSSSSVVGESYLTGGPGTESGSGNLSATVSIKPSETTTLSIKYTFSNDAYVMTNAAGGGAQAAYHFDITIKDSTGTVIFDSATANTNLSLGAPPNGVEVIKTGSETVVTPSLTANATYTFIFSQSAGTFVNLPTPEPSSVVMASSAIGICLLGARLRRRTAR